MEGVHVGGFRNFQEGVGSGRSPQKLKQTVKVVYNNFLTFSFKKIRI